MRKILSVLLAVLFALLPTVAAAQESTTVRTSVPSHHTITIVCGDNGGAVIDGVRYTGTFTIQAERLGTLTISAQPDGGYALSQIKVGDMDGVTVNGGKITLTGIHCDNTVTLTFCRLPVVTPSATDPGEVLPELPATGNNLYDDFLGTGDGFGELSIVFDGDYAPRDYELLNIQPDSEEMEGTILVRAYPEEDGEFGRRSLILSALQLTKLEQKQGAQSLIFENGDAAAILSMEDLLDGDVGKLIGLIVSRDGLISAETLDTDWSSLEQQPLTGAELARVKVEVRIIPMEDGSYDFSAWLRWGEEELDITSLLPSLHVALDADGENADGCTLAHRAEDGESYLPLDSEFVYIPAFLPTDQPDVGEKFIVTMPDTPGDDPATVYHATAPLHSERHGALAAGYDGRGGYRLEKD